MKKKMPAMLLCLILALSVLAGCSARTNDAAELNSGGFYVEPGASNEKMEIAADGLYSTVESTPATGKTALVTEQKLIKTASIDAQTEDMDTLLAELGAQIDTLGGYVENREVYNGSTYSNRNTSRYASMTIRVPVENLNALVQQVQGIANVTRHNENVDDVTLHYVDTASHKAALETEYDRLLVLLEKAETMSDLLEIEARLTDVRYELENITSQLRVYDNKITYATVNLSIEEVQKLTPVAEPTLGQRISGGFVESLEDVGEGLMDFLVFLLANSPRILLWAVIILGAFFLIRQIRRKKREKKQREQEVRSRQQPTDETGKTEG